MYYFKTHGNTYYNFKYLSGTVIVYDDSLFNLSTTHMPTSDMIWIKEEEFNTKKEESINSIYNAIQELTEENCSCYKDDYAGYIVYNEKLLKYTPTYISTYQMLMLPTYCEHQDFKSSKEDILLTLKHIRQ